MADRPIGSLQVRKSKAIHLYHTSELTNEEIADELGVTPDTVTNYLNSEPAAEVDEFLAEQQAEVREAAAEDYKQDLRTVGEQARTAETPVKIWTDENGELEARPIKKQVGEDPFGEPIYEVVDYAPIPQGMEMGPDETERYFRRQEKREILRDWRQMVGADAPEESKHEITGEDGGPLEITFNETTVESDWSPDGGGE